MRTTISNTLKVSALVIALSFGATFVSAWTAPTQTPPNGNVSAPINTSTSNQTKSGGLLSVFNLWAEALGVTGGATFGGNVGIGVPNPGAKLEVSGGNINVRSTTGDAILKGFNVAGGDATLFLTGTANTANWKFNTFSTAGALFIQNDGKVGIGTMAPAYNLDVYSGSIRATKFYDYNSPSSYYVDPSSSSSLYGLALGGGTLLSTYFGSGSSLGNDRIEIGTNDPRQRLGIGITGWSGKEAKATIHNAQQSNPVYPYTPIDANKYSLLVTHNSGGSVGVQDFAIDNTGKVGIGTSAPVATLDVNGYMKLKPQTSAPVVCSASYKGSIAYASANNKLCLCNGTSWVYEGGALNCGW